MARPRRSASDALKGTAAAETLPDVDDATPAGAEADTTADAPAGDTPSTEAPAEDPADAPAEGEDGTEDDDVEDGPEDVEVTVLVDAFNYFQDDAHQTARKGDRLVISREAAERGLDLNAVRVEEQD